MSINEFLNRIADDMKLNNRLLNKDDFYYMLKYLGVKNDVSLVSDIEKFYQDFLNSLNNSLVKYVHKKQKFGENVTHYIAFYTDKKGDCRETVKVYFPVKYAYLISALKTIFLYLIRNNIMATVKFHVKATNEAIVIRFYDRKDAMPFINYCNNNFVLKDLLVDLNPFMASYSGIGLVNDDNTSNSFNGILSEVLEEYFKMHYNDKSLDNVSAEDFLGYLINRANNESNNEVKFNIKQVINSVNAILKRG